MSQGNRVGIGITDPQYTLDVAGDLNVSGGLYFNGENVSGSLYWSETSAENIVTNANVGIGVTEEPLEKLHVEGNILMAGNLIPAANEQYDLGTPTASFRDIYLSGTTIFLGNTKISTDVNTGEITFRDKETDTLQSIVTENTQNIVSVDGNTIFESGNVGIGITAPQFKLHVSGNTRIDGDLTVNGTQTIVNTEVETTSRLEITNTGTGPAVLVNQTGTQPIADFQDDGVSSLFIADGGNVGIGLTDPIEKLHVNGNARVTGQVLQNNGFTNVVYNGNNTFVGQFSVTDSIDQDPFTPTYDFYPCNFFIPTADNVSGGGAEDNCFYSINAKYSIAVAKHEPDEPEPPEEIEIHTGNLEILFERNVIKPGTLVKFQDTPLSKRPGNIITNHVWSLRWDDVAGTSTGRMQLQLTITNVRPGFNGNLYYCVEGSVHFSGRNKAQLIVPNTTFRDTVAYTSTDTSPAAVGLELAGGDLRIDSNKSGDGGLEVFNNNTYSLYIHGNGGSGTVQGKSLVNFHHFARSTITTNNPEIEFEDATPTGQIGFIENGLFGWVGNFVVRTKATSAKNEPLVDRLRIMGETGNVGIGTTNPSELLHVVGNVKRSGAVFTERFSFSNITTGPSSSWNYIGTYGSGFTQSGPIKVRILSSGNSRLGTAEFEIHKMWGEAPVVKLARNGDAAQWQFSFSSIADNEFALYVRDVATLGNTIGFVIFVETDRLFANSPPPSPVNTILNVDMNILKNGNVGIGVTNPSQRLHVVGQMAVENGDGFTPRLNFISGPNNTNPWRIRANVNDSTNIGLLFEENTTTLMSIRSGGNVGIGTDSPTENLHVGGNLRINGDRILCSTNGTAVWIGMNGSASEASRLGIAVRGTTTGVVDLVALRTDGVSRMIVSQNGNVGIGTASPTQRLHVEGGNVLVRRDWGSDVGPIMMVKSNNTAIAGQTAGDVNTTVFRILGSRGGSGVGSNLITNLSSHLRSRDNTTFHIRCQEIDVDDNLVPSNPDVFTVKGNGDMFAAGNVGIGFRNPEHKLDLAVENSASNSDVIRFQPRNGPSTDSTSGIIWKPLFTNYTKRSAGILQTAEGNAFRSGLAFFTNNTVTLAGDFLERMRINMDGNVGIGTTSPTQRLHVIGTVLADNFTFPSDTRIKTDIAEIQDGNALHKLRLIEPHEYNYVDKETRGDHRVFGFLAQQVREHFPEAINIMKAVVPDVNKLCPVDLEEHTILLGTQARDGKLQIRLPNRTLDLQVTKVDDERVAYTPEDLEENIEIPSEVFVVGYEVDDFHTLNKDFLFTVNFAATQELDRVVQSQKGEIEDLKQVNDDLMIQNMSLKNRVSDLEMQLASLLTALTDKGVI
jgi:hypothetical protein